MHYATTHIQPGLKNGYPIHCADFPPVHSCRPLLSGANRDTVWPWHRNRKHTHTHIHYTHTCVAVSQNRSANGCVENGDFWDLRSRRTRIGTHTDKHREQSAQSNILSLIVAFMLVFFQLFLSSLKLLFIGNKIRDGTVSLFSFFNSFGFPRGQCGLLHNHHFHRVKTPPSMSG